MNEQGSAPQVVIRTDGLSSEAQRLMDSVARRAYEIFESKGRPIGMDLENWFQAEAELFERTPLQVTESPDALAVQADIHGYRPQELEVDLEPRRVTIIGKHQSDVQTNRSGASYSEFRSARLLRSVLLPVEIDLNRVSCQVKKGILELDIKKAVSSRSGKPQSPATRAV